MKLIFSSCFFVLICLGRDAYSHGRAVVHSIVISTYFLFTCLASSQRALTSSNSDAFVVCVDVVVVIFVAFPNPLKLQGAVHLSAAPFVSGVKLAGEARVHMLKNPVGMATCVTQS